MSKEIFGFFRRFWAVLAACGLVGLSLVLPLKTVYAANPGPEPSAEAPIREQEEQPVYISSVPDRETEAPQQARAPNEDRGDAVSPAVLSALADATTEPAETLAASDPEEPGMEADALPAAAADNEPVDSLGKTAFGTTPAESGPTEAEQPYLYAPQEGAEANLYVMVRCVDGQAKPLYHQSFTIPTPAGDLTARNNQTGTACLGPLAPGDYTLVSGLGTVEFTLLENGAVQCQAPLCCGDGEYLTLSKTPWASLTLELGLEARRSFTVTDAAGENHLCLLSPDPAGAVSVPAWTFSLLPPGPATVRWTDLDTGQTGSLDLDLGPGERVTAYMTQ